MDGDHEPKEGTQCQLEYMPAWTCHLIYATDMMMERGEEIMRHLDHNDGGKKTREGSWWFFCRDRIYGQGTDHVTVA